MSIIVVIFPRHETELSKIRDRIVLLRSEIQPYLYASGKAWADNFHRCQLPFRLSIE